MNIRRYFHLQKWHNCVGISKRIILICSYTCQNTQGEMSVYWTWIVIKNKMIRKEVKIFILGSLLDDNFKLSDVFALINSLIFVSILVFFDRGLPEKNKPINIVIFVKIVMTLSLNVSYFSLSIVLSLLYVRCSRFSHIFQVLMFWSIASVISDRN